MWRLLLMTVVALNSIAVADADLFGPGWSGKRDQANACYEAVDRDVEFQSLRGRLVFDAPTLGQLSDETVPSSGDVDTIESFWRKRSPCREMMVMALREHHPFLLPAYEIRNFQWDIVFAHLLKRRITFGNANQLIYDAELEYRQRKASYDQSRSDEQRRAIAQSLDRVNQQARSAPPPPPGVGRLKCRWVGPTLYCDPY